MTLIGKDSTKTGMDKGSGMKIMTGKKIIVLFLLGSFFNVALALEEGVVKKNLCVFSFMKKEKKSYEKNLNIKEFEVTKEPIVAFENMLKLGDCEYLEINGFFNGTFYGPKGGELSYEDLETLRCKETNRDLFKKIKVVFLYGSNTLENSDKINRKDQEYQEVLAEEGVNENDLEFLSNLRKKVDRNIQTISLFENAKIVGFTGPAPEKLKSALSFSKAEKDKIRDWKRDMYARSIDGKNLSHKFKEVGDPCDVKKDKSSHHESESRGPKKSVDQLKIKEIQKGQALSDS